MQRTKMATELMILAAVFACAYAGALLGHGFGL